MSALTPVLAKLATSKIEVVGNSSEAQHAKNLEALFLEHGFVALVGAMQQGATTCQAGCCSSCSSGGGNPGLCCCPCCCCV